MAKSVAPKRQVFVIYALADRLLADRIIASLSGAGLTVAGFRHTAPTDDHGGAYDDRARRAIQSSDAVVVVLSRATAGAPLPASVLFEMGAALGAGKATYVVTEDATVTLPFLISRLRVLPANRIDEVSQAVLDPAA